MVFLTLDIGTTAAKIVAFDQSGGVVAEAREGYTTLRPCPGWAEQDPDQWWQAVVQGIRRVMQKLKKRAVDVQGISLTGQMHGTVLLDARRRLLMPCLIWMDTRAQKQAEAIEQLLGKNHLISITGNPAAPAFPAAKLMWIREVYPLIYKKIRWLLMPKDYIGYRLTGVIATDPSDASGTLLYNLRKGDWETELLANLQINPAILPPILSSTSVLGKLNKKTASTLSLKSGTPVVIGAGDLATSALGVGVVNSCKLGLILGTAGQLLFSLDHIPEQLLGKFYFFAHAVPSACLGLGTLPTGGAALAWLAKILFSSGENARTTFSKLLKLAEQVPPGAQNLFFLPYLAGTGTPHLDYRMKGAFLGLTESHGPKELVRAVLEGVGYGLRDSLQLLYDYGINVQEIRIAGGSIRSKLWIRILADIFGAPLHVVRLIDASPTGALLLALVGLNYKTDLLGSAKEIVTIKEKVVPTEAAKFYDQKFAIFRTYVQIAQTHRLNEEEP